MADKVPQRPPSRSARRRARYREIVTVVREERLFDLLRGAGLEEHLSPEVVGKEVPSAKEADLPLAVRVRHAVERLGPVFIKIGQLLSTRSDLLPPALLEELCKLQDDVPAVTWSEMRYCLEAELGAAVEDLFATFDEKPLAAGSIGQVYRAALPDGTAVAVKVRRPGVTEAMELDLDILHDLAERLTRHVQWARDSEVSRTADGFASVLRAEVDYANEARTLDYFRSAFADDPSLVFPQVYWDHTTSRVLTMDLIEGVPATELQKSEQTAGVDRTHLVEIGVGAYFRMIFELGLYHADPHAGNLFALPDGRLGFVDCGRVATISERNRQGTFDMVMAVFDDDPAGVTEAVLSMTGMPPHVDLAAFEIDVSRLLAQYRHEQASGKGFGKLLQSLLGVMRDHRLQIPGELSVLLATLGVLDGVATQLDPSFRMMEAARPFARKLMPEQYGPERLIKGTLRSARAYVRFFDELPVNATRALRRVSEGEFRVAVRPDDYADLVDRLTAGVYLLAYAIIVGALIVGFAFIVGRQELTQPERIGYRMVLLAAIASVIWLLIKSLHNEWRKSQANRRPR
jgi:ubiquinone biosynthesis protein